MMCKVKKKSKAQSIVRQKEAPKMPLGLPASDIYIGNDNVSKIRILQSAHRLVLVYLHGRNSTACNPLP